MDQDLERILANDFFGWVTVSCIYEDVIDPEHDIEADREMVEICEVKSGEWTETDREAVEVGIKERKSHKHGIELNSMKFEPWLDEQHRRYWFARRKGKVCIVTFFWGGTGSI